MHVPLPTRRLPACCRSGKAAILSLPLIVLFATTASALDPNRTLTQCVHRIWQIQQGLPQATIDVIRQSSDGYLWLGTRTGLVRFDGVRFDTLPNVESTALANTWIRDIQEAPDGTLWVATEGAGLFRLSNGTATHFTTTDGLPSDSVRCLAIDPQGIVWIGTESGLARLTGGKIESYREDPALPIKNIRALCISKDGIVTIGGDGNQIYQHHQGKFTPRQLNSLPADVTVNALICSQSGSIWIGSSDGLLGLTGNDEKRLSTANGLAANKILALASGSNDSLYIGTTEGFSRLRDGEIETIGTRDGLSQSTVYALREDREGALWIGTKHGLNQFLERRTIPYTESEGLPSNNAGPIVQDATGTIWAGTLDAGLARFDGRRFVLAAASPELPSNKIIALTDGSSRELWIGTDNGLCKFVDQKVTQTLTTQDGLPSNSIRALTHDTKGILWIGTTQGVAKLAHGKITPLPFDFDPFNVPVLAMVSSDAGIIVATENRGLFFCESNDTVSAVASTPHADVVAFYRDDEGALWMGTRGQGLYLLKQNSINLVSFSVRSGLHDDDIRGITADNRGQLWMACSQGVFSVPRSELIEHARGTRKRLNCTPISPTDSLRTIECQEGVQPTVCRAQDDKIWFSTMRGLTVVNPNRVQRELPPTPVVIEDVTINGKSEVPGGHYRLPPGEANVSFRFTALSFVAPTRITFRYRLEGFDKDWIDAGSRREAFYTNLPPGHYSFRVKAINVDGGQTETARPVEITVAPHLYQTVWFLPACAALTVFAGWSAYRMRVRRIRQQLQMVVAERSRIARELHDTLMQGFSGITMEMQALSTQLPASAQRAALEDIIHDAGTCLTEARRSIAGLRGDRSAFATSVAQTARQLTETHDIRLKLRLDNSLPKLADDTEYQLLRIAQEALQNAVKHSNCRSIEVAWERISQEAQLSITDDGIGFDPENTNQSAAGHYGLIGMRERANQIGAELQVKSNLGTGTNISVSVVLISHFPAPSPAAGRAGEGGSVTENHIPPKTQP